MKFFNINVLYKADTAKITWRQKLFIFFFILQFFILHICELSYLYFQKKIYVPFYPFNCFFGINKSVLNSNLKTITSSTIYRFPSYFASDGTVRNFHKLMEYFTQVFRNMPKYSFFQHISNYKLVMLIFILWL